MKNLRFKKLGIQLVNPQYQILKPPNQIDNNLDEKTRIGLPFD